MIQNNYFMNVQTASAMHSKRKKPTVTQYQELNSTLTSNVSGDHNYRSKSKIPQSKRPKSGYTVNKGEERNPFVESMKESSSFIENNENKPQLSMIKAKPMT